jgi:predicted acetyltransferase
LNRNCQFERIDPIIFGFRWKPNTSELPEYVLGHIGFAVVPWKQGRGYSKLALKLLLPEAKSRGLNYVEFSTDIDNVKSQQVIMANGRVLVKPFKRPAYYGNSNALRYRIDLANI